MKKLSPQQKKVVQFIRDYNSKTELAPTVYEIADYLSVKPATAFAHVRALQKKNIVARTSKARSIKLIEKSSRNYHDFEIPLHYDPSDVDFTHQASQFLYCDVNRKYKRFKDTLCTLKINFDLKNSYDIRQNDILTLVKDPDHFILEPGMILLVWDPERQYYFAAYDTTQKYTYRIVAAVIALQRSV